METNFLFHYALTLNEVKQTDSDCFDTNSETYLNYQVHQKTSIIFDAMKNKNAKFCILKVTKEHSYDVDQWLAC